MAAAGSVAGSEIRHVRVPWAVPAGSVAGPAQFRPVPAGSGRFRTVPDSSVDGSGRPRGRFRDEPLEPGLPTTIPQAPWGRCFGGALPASGGWGGGLSLRMLAGRPREAAAPARGNRVPRHFTSTAPSCTSVTVTSLVAGSPDEPPASAYGPQQVPTPSYQ